MRGRTPALDPRPVAHGAAGGGQVAVLPEGERHEPQDRRVARVGVARVDEPLGGEPVVALGHRVLRGAHEALHARGAGVGGAEVHELEASRGHRPHADLRT